MSVAATAARADPELPRVLAGARTDGGPVGVDAHLDRYGPLPAAGELVELVAAAGLRGRGGAGFPAARKLQAVRDARRQPVVVANAVEGEPISGKDRALLRHVPHLVLDGAALAAAAVGAREAIVAIGAQARHELEVVRHALAARARRRLDRIPVRLETVPHRFVAGEETALVSWLNGSEPKPTFTPPRPFERGVGGAPTLVQNVETLANLALIARFGADWFRELGTDDEPGSALVTLGGAVHRAGVYEIPLGLPLGEVVEWAGGSSARLSSFLVGGYFGTWVPAPRALTLGLADAELRQAGAALGARAIYALPERVCGLAETARVTRYLSDESAGQCGPCVHGLAAIAGALERLASGGGRDAEDVARLERWTAQVEGRGACRHPDGASRFVASALAVFRDEVDRHLRGRCSGLGAR